jgi:hypothetical protein
MDKQKIVLIGSLVILFSALNYVLLEDFFNQNQKNIEESFLAGRDQGIKDTISIIFNQTNNCNPVAIFLDNSTKNLIDFECLNLLKNSTS